MNENCFLREISFWYKIEVEWNKIKINNVWDWNYVIICFKLREDF